MKLPLLQYGNPLLRTKAKTVESITEETLQFIRDLEDTMRSFDGLGIAATQVGKLVSIFLIAPPIYGPDNTVTQGACRAFINPKLSNPSSEEWSHEEGNPVLPHLTGQVVRPREITVTAQNIDGTWFTETFKDWPARIIMHENDHLNGVLFIDRLSQKERKKLDPKIRALKK
jgi:peptide deformylase